MSYQLVQEPPEHLVTLSQTLQGWTQGPQDLYMVSREGHRVYSQQAILGLYSPSMARLLAELRDPCPGFTVDASSSTISRLLNILTTGKTTAAEIVDLEEVKKVARSLGVTLTNCEVEGKAGLSRIVTVPSLRQQPKAQLPFENKKTFSKSISISALNKSIVGQPPNNSTNVPKKKISITKSLVKPTDSNSKNNFSPPALPNTKANLSIVKQEKDLEENIENVEKIESNKKVLIQGKKGFACGKCPKRFNEKRGRRRHHKRKHPNVEYEDSVETRTIQEEKVAKIKKEKVGGAEKSASVLEESFDCGDCDKSFSRKSSLKNHEVLHLDELPYKCEHCEKMFSQAGNLRTHSAKYHGVNIPPSRTRVKKDEREAEDGEGEETVGSENLNEESSFPNISYLCEHCDEVFPMGDDLSSHIRTVHNISD